MGATAHLAYWNEPRIAGECGRAYSQYRRRRTASYRAYFAERPRLRAPNHPYTARDLEAALPHGWGVLGDHLPVGERHRYHLSGNSSQVLALGLLGVASVRDPSLGWLWSALGTLPSPVASRPRWQLERALLRETLDEHPRQTSIDYFVEDPAAVICTECKWTEAGIGSCSCASGNGGNPREGRCAQRVLERGSYRRVANEVFHLPERRAGYPCPLSFTYQAVRNVAAALALADGDQLAVVALIYDAGNPYFGGCGEWPGWPAALGATLRDVHPRLAFRSASWQELMAALPLDDAARAWASEKHGLM